MFAENDLGGDVLASCSRVLAGFVLAAVIGVPVGLAIGTFHSMDSLFSPIVVKEQLGGVKLFDLAANKAMAFDKSNPKSLIGNLELTAKAAAEFKIIPQPLKPESLYDDSIVKSL